MSGEDNPTVTFENGKRLGEWIIVKKLDEGGFGQVYLVEHFATKGKLAALKAEPKDVEGGSAIKLELAVIRAMTEDGEKPHIPQVYHAAKHKAFCYMVMTLFGQNLKALKIQCTDEYLSPQTWSRIGIQCLYSIKFVHDYGYIHRDIKPNNFVLGHKEDLERARLVHILDFGLARDYAYKDKKTGKWIARRARGTAEIRGTIRYCSPNVHMRKEQGRRDDLWSLFYMLLELHCGLPWQSEREKEQVEKIKMNISDKDLVINFPSELHGIVPALRLLDYYQRPDYNMFYDGLLAIMKRLKVKSSDPYDWESREMAEKYKPSKPPAWENATDFFKSDPVKIHCAPPLKNLDKSNSQPGTMKTIKSKEKSKEKATGPAK